LPWERCAIADFWDWHKIPAFVGCETGPLSGAVQTFSPKTSGTLIGRQPIVSNGTLKGFSFLVTTSTPEMGYDKFFLACLASIDNARAGGYNDIGF